MVEQTQHFIRYKYSMVLLIYLNEFQGSYVSLEYRFPQDKAFMFFTAVSLCLEQHLVLCNHAVILVEWMKERCLENSSSIV